MVKLRTLASPLHHPFNSEVDLLEYKGTRPLPFAPELLGASRDFRCDPLFESVSLRFAYPLFGDASEGQYFSGLCEMAFQNFSSPIAAIPLVHLMMKHPDKDFESLVTDSSGYVHRNTIGSEPLTESISPQRLSFIASESGQIVETVVCKLPDLPVKPKPSGRVVESKSLNLLNVGGSDNRRFNSCLDALREIEIALKSEGRDFAKVISSAMFRSPEGTRILPVSGTPSAALHFEWTRFKGRNGGSKITAYLVENGS